MFTVALISRKGGAGKTTLACGLAVASEQEGLVTALVDLDPAGFGLGVGQSPHRRYPRRHLGTRGPNYPPCSLQHVMPVPNSPLSTPPRIPPMRLSQPPSPLT